MSHISVNNIDRKLICVSISSFSVSRNPMWQLHWSVGAVAAIFKMADTNFQMSDISANNEDRNLMLVSISMFSWSEKSNMINIICQSLFFFFKMAATLINVAITSTQNNYMLLVVVSAVVYSII